jgi:hypothetical protein
MEPALILLILAGLADATALYAALVSRRTRYRRHIDARLEESARLYGVVRVAMADRRTT